MNVEQLREVREAYKEREQLKEKIAEFENMRISPRGVAYGSERVQSSPKGDIQADNIASLDSLIERYNEQLRKCVALIGEFETALSVLEPRERRMMRMYYINGMTWEQVCVEMNLSWTPLHNARRNAIAKMCPGYQPTKGKRKNER